MPIRVLLTGKLHGPDMGSSILLIYKAGQCGALNPQFDFINFDERFKIIKEIDWDSLNKEIEARPKSEAEAQPKPAATATH